MDPVFAEVSTLPVLTRGLVKLVKDRGTVANATVDMRLKADISSIRVMHITAEVLFPKHSSYVSWADLPM